MIFPTTPVLDDFNRADSATTLGANWTLLAQFSGSAGDMGISSNQAYNPTVGNELWMRWNVAAYGPNCECYVTAPVLPSSVFVAIGARIEQFSVGDYNGYELWVDESSGDWYFYRVDNGNYSQLGDTASQAIESGDSIGIRCVGDSIEAWHKPAAGEWTLVASRTDATYGDAGHLSLYGNPGTSQRWDDFGGGTVVTEPVLTLQWAGALDADADTDYRIEADKSAPGEFAAVATVDATDRGDGEYFPFESTLDGVITAEDTTLTLADGSDFAEGDYVAIDKEMIRLGAKDTNTFDNCQRGVGETIPQGHETGAAVYAAHESYGDGDVEPGSRRVIRYRVIRVQDTDESVAAELVAVFPPSPPDTSMVTLYGVLDDLQGQPKPGVTVTLALGEADNYTPSSGELINRQTVASTETDDDGFWSLFVNRDVDRIGGGAYTLNVGDLAWVPVTLPDQNKVNFLLT